MMCAHCGSSLAVGDWPFCPHGAVQGHDAEIHTNQRAVRYYHPQHGWRTPGRSDRPMPDRLRELGFERKEFKSVRELERHARETGSRAEVIDHDPNSHLAERQYNEKPNA